MMMIKEIDVVMIQKILVQIDDKEFVLTIEQARRLRDELDELFSQPPKGPIYRNSNGFEPTQTR